MVNPELLSAKLADRRFVYRALGPKDTADPKKDGLDPRDGDADVAIVDAIAQTGKKKENQFIHCTLNSRTALWYAEGRKSKDNRHEIAKIDLFRLARGPRIIDRSGNRARLLTEGSKAAEAARDSEIVLITDFINASAIVDVMTTKDLDLGKQKKNASREEFIEALPEDTQTEMDNFHFRRGKGKGKGARKGKGKGKKGKGKDEEEEASKPTKSKKGKGKKGKKGKGKDEDEEEEEEEETKKPTRKSKGKKGKGKKKEADDDDDDDDEPVKGKGKKGKKGGKKGKGKKGKGKK